MSEQMSENTKYVRKWTFLQIIIFKNIAMKYEKGSIDYANFMTRYNLIIYFYRCLLMNFELDSATPRSVLVLFEQHGHQKNWPKKAFGRFSTRIFYVKTKWNTRFL